MKKVYKLFIFLCIFPLCIWGQSKSEVYKDDIKLVLYPKTGRFSLYQLSDQGKNKYNPLIDERNASNSSFFTVSFNGKTYKIQKKLGTKLTFEETEHGGQFVFTQNDDFQISQYFSLIDDINEDNNVFLKIETRIENTSGSEAKIALKSLIDTFLGETTLAHFYTDGRDAVLNEVKIITAIDPDTFVCSRGTNNTLYFYLDNPIGTKPEYVYIANWERLNTKTWLPDYIAGRSFNTIYSVNDSALLFIWPEQVIPNKSSTTITMLLGTEMLANIASPNSIFELETKNPEPDILLQTPTSSMHAEENYLDNHEDKIKQLNYIQERIREIEINPESATQNELILLNQALDDLLLEL